MEEKLVEIGESDFFEIRIFMTRGWTKDDAAKIFLQDDDKGLSV
jgi:NADPH oxidase